jgi:beta-glucosidase
MPNPPIVTDAKTVTVELQKGTLPEGFLWGSSTSSYQIEGAAREDGRGASIWDSFCRQKGRIGNGDTGDVACDHYHRYAEDIALMRDLGLKAYRFSTAWPRVLPLGRGAANEKGLDFYDRLIDGVLEAGIEPWLCLYHWDLPQSLDDLGGWTNRDIAGWFADYAALIARRYGDRVKRFATFNEPSVAIMFGYAMGWNAPGVAERSSYFKAVHHLNLAHGRAVDVIRSLVPAASIGIVHNRQQVYPESDKPEDIHAATLLDTHWNLIFPDPQNFAAYPALAAADMEPYQQAGDMAQICRPTDWFGLNHYSPIYARADAGSQLGFAWGKAPDEIAQTGIGWPIYPDAFREILIDTSKRYGLPVYVTENGCGDKEAPDAAGNIVDERRIDYLRAYTLALGEAVKAGADVRGYFVWSLLDNFEWGAGFANRFGLVYVDFDTLKRTPKASAHWYAATIRRLSSPA